MEWIRPGELKGATKIEQDNQSAIYLVSKKTLNKRSKHYGKDYFFVTEKVENEVVELRKQKSEFITSDVLTKPLMKQTFEEHVRKLLGPEDKTQASNSSDQSLFGEKGKQNTIGEIIQQGHLVRFDQRMGG